MKNTLLHVELVVPQAIETPKPNPHARFLQSISGFRDHRALGWGAPGTTKSENMGRIAAELAPDADGTFLIELAAVLQDRLPSSESQHEYVLSVPDTQGRNPKEMCFSNQMVRVRFLRNNDPYHLICPLYRLKEVREGKTAAPTDAPFEYLRTVVATRYKLAGHDADDALSTDLEQHVFDFISRVNRVLAAHLLVASEQAGILTPSYDAGSFDYLYVLLSGANPANIRSERLGLSLFRTSIVGLEYDAEQTAEFSDYLSGVREPDDAVLLVRSAKSYLEGGVLHLALLQLAIAAIAG